MVGKPQTLPRPDMHYRVHLIAQSAFTVSRYTGKRRMMLKRAICRYGRRRLEPSVPVWYSEDVMISVS